MNLGTFPAEPSAPEPPLEFELRFASLFGTGRTLSFPCDRAGHVQLDALSERARDNYLLARALMGRDYASPRVLRCFEGVRH